MKSLKMSNTSKRAHHNAAERRRRQTLKEAYASVRKVLPMFQDDKGARGHVLREAAAYIKFMTKKNAAHQRDIDDLASHIKALDDQIALLKRSKSPKSRASAALVVERARMAIEKREDFDAPEYEDSSESEEDSS